MDLYNDFVKDLQLQKQQLEQEINELESKIRELQYIQWIECNQ